MEFIDINDSFLILKIVEQNTADNDFEKFIADLHLDANVLSTPRGVIPFAVWKDYVFYAPNNDDGDLAFLKAKLNESKNDLTTISKKLSGSQLFDASLLEKPYLLHNQEIYKFDE